MSASDLEGEVFERPLPPGRLALACAALVFTLTQGFVSPQLAASGLMRLADGLPWLERDVAGWLALQAVLWAPGLTLVTAGLWASRRFGRAVVTQDHVVLWPIFGRAWLPWTIVLPREDVTSVRQTTAGLVLAAAPDARRWLVSRLIPALVPAHEGDLARAHALLEPGRGEAPPGMSAPGRSSRRVQLGLALGVIAMAAAALCGEVLGLIGLLLALVPAIAVVCVSGIMAAAERWRVHLGAGTLSVGMRCAAWTSVARLAIGGDWFVLDLDDGRRAAARVGPAGVAALAPIARDRLAAAGRAHAFVDHAPAWLARRRALCAPVIGGLLALSVWWGPLEALVREGCLSLTDHHGYDVRLVHRALDGAPRLVVISDPHPGPLTTRAGGLRSARFGDEDEPEDGVSVDARRGVARWLGREFALPPGVTVVHVRADGVSTSTRPLPRSPGGRAMAQLSPAGGVLHVSAGLELLELWFPGTDDPVLRDALDGRTSVRCFQGGAPTRLLSKVSRGVVDVVAVLGQATQRPRGCEVCQLVAAAPPRGSDPTLERLLEAQAAVSRGVPVEEATAGFDPRSAR